MTTERTRKLDPIGTDVIAGAQQGLESAWQEIYGRLAEPVTGYLKARGASDPEDLCAEVFFQIARDIHRFHGSGDKFRSWVFVIAHRRLIDARRAQGRRPQTVEEPLSQFDRIGGDVEDEVMTELGNSQVAEIFNSLTDEQKTVLALRVVADLSLEETAVVMGKRVGAVKALQRRALASVKAKLDDGRVSL